MKNTIWKFNLKRRVEICICILLFSTLFSFTVFAEESTRTDKNVELPEEYKELLDKIPSDIKELLPDEIFSDDFQTVVEGVKKVTGFHYAAQVIFRLIGLHIRDAFGLLATLCGTVIVASAFRSYKNSFGISEVGEYFSFCVNLVLFCEVISICYKTAESAFLFIKILNTLVSAVLPLMTVLYSMGGNIAQAVVNSASLSLFLFVSENVIGKTIIPFFSACMAFILASELFSDSVNIKPICNMIKKAYTTVLSLITMFFSSVMGMQSFLASRSDSLTMKGVKFITGNMIPIVGGTVGDSLRTVAASVNLLRGAIGIFALVTLILIFLSCVISVLMSKGAISVTSSIADMLGCTKEKSLLSEICNLYGYLIAAISICTVMFVFSLTLFIKCASAVG